MGDNNVPVSSRIDEELDEKVTEFQERKELSRSGAVRELLIRQLRHEEQDTSVLAIMAASTLGASLAVGLGLLLAGFTAAGGALFGGALFVAVNWSLARLFGWGNATREAVGELVEGFRRVGGFRGFYLRLFDSAAPVEEATTPVERAARWDRWVPALFGVALAYLGVLYAIIQFGYLDALGSGSALVLALGALAVVYIPPLTMALSSLAQLAIETAARWSASRDTTPETD